VHRLALALGLVGALAVPAVTATAAPVGTHRIAVAELRLADREGGWQQVTLRVTSASRVALAVRSCDTAGCTSPAYYGGRLPRGAVDVDSSAASAALRARLGGRAVTVTWTPAPAAGPAVVVGGTEGSSDDDSTAVSTYRLDPATARVQVDAADCTVAAGVGDEVRVESPEGSDGAARPLSALKLGTGCAPADGSAAG
jgi:hypothetical protein